MFTGTYLRKESDNLCGVFKRKVRKGYAKSRKNFLQGNTLRTLRPDDSRDCVLCGYIRQTIY